MLKPDGLLYLLDDASRNGHGPDFVLGSRKRRPPVSESKGFATTLIDPRTFRLSSRVAAQRASRAAHLGWRHYPRSGALHGQGHLRRARHARQEPRLPAARDDRDAAPVQRHRRQAHVHEPALQVRQPDGTVTTLRCHAPVQGGPEEDALGRRPGGRDRQV